MRTSIISALALTGLMASAQAADLDSLKDPLPDTLTWRGVTVYGVIDVGFGYQSDGLATSGALYTGQGYNIYGESLVNGKRNASVTNNALSQSTIGVKIEEPLGYGFTALGHIDTGFNPISGEIADACKSLVEVANAAVNGSKLQAFGDGSRCGQAFNGEAYAGLSNASYGTLKIGRQNSLELDALANYDPMGLSYSMSLLGWSGFSGAGAGSTETARWDNSVKYIFQYGPVHAAAMYAGGAQDTSLHGDSVAGNIGGTWRGFSIDGVYTSERGAVNAQLGTIGNFLGFNVPAGAPATGGGDVNSLYGFLTNNEAYSIMGKYTFLFDNGFKDAGAASKLTIFAGYNHTDQTAGGGNFGASDGTTIGGYVIFDNLQFLSTRTLETEWAGAKYESGPWSFTGAYYHVSQNSFSEKNFVIGGGVGGCAMYAFTCSGDTSTGSFLVDYAFDKHFDVYAGVAYSSISGGLAHSSTDNRAYAFTDNTSVVSGLRLKF